MFCGVEYVEVSESGLPQMQVLIWLLAAFVHTGPLPMNADVSSVEREPIIRSGLNTMSHVPFRISAETDTNLYTALPKRVPEVWSELHKASGVIGVLMAAGFGTMVMMRKDPALAEDSMTNSVATFSGTPTGF